MDLNNRGSHTTSESDFILGEWARGEARLVVQQRRRFILGDSFFSSGGEEEFSILHSSRIKIYSSAHVFHLYAAALLLLFDFL